ncbi:hypothetical protein HELRODRAFT_81227 [Helobdella robusta]|uniref:Nuclease EXOG, mitochondrial n=1 Tax=Helobdella robusta TaxID=6412 RepID=T1G4B7_HELRO|nr:hypothetical protein HELRODRAFT_81227 [Helobdella robusta]ESO02821.1 hypothetical protein HELRODRAFT_81227 [Helobdella robusta]
MLRLGYPLRSPDLVVYKNYALCYDQQKKIPHWVLELLVENDLKGDGNRNKSNFKSDPNFSVIFSSQNEDYLKSGWSRGHMAAAGNHKYDQDAMNDTFYLTNVVPQDLNNNAEFWNRIEIHCRGLLKNFNRVWLVSGPMFLSRSQGNKKFIEYEVIGKSEVAVPTHLYKVVLAEKNDKIAMGCFVVPNKPIPREQSLKEHQVPLEFIEAKTGFTFFPKLEQRAVEDLCKIGGCQMKTAQEFELYYLTKQMDSARNLNHLEKLWKQIGAKSLKPDAEASNVYNRKKSEFKKLDNFQIVKRSEQTRKG